MVHDSLRVMTEHWLRVNYNDTISVFQFHNHDDIWFFINLLMELQFLLLREQVEQFRMGDLIVILSNSILRVRMQYLRVNDFLEFLAQIYLPIK